MAKKALGERTTMYSLDGKGNIVKHSLPWPKDSEKLGLLKERGFRFKLGELAFIRPGDVGNLVDVGDAFVPKRGRRPKAK